jgi:hypothetical protein
MSPTCNTAGVSVFIQSVLVVERVMEDWAIPVRPVRAAAAKQFIQWLAVQRTVSDTATSCSNGA